MKLFEILEERYAEDATDDQLLDVFKKVGDQLMAAKRGLGLANKLKSKNERKLHRKRVMKNLNIIRTDLRRLEKRIMKLD